MSVMKIVIITVIILLSLDFYLYMVNSFNIEKYTSPDKYGIFLTNTTIPEKGKKIAEDSRAVLCCLARNNESFPWWFKRPGLQIQPPSIHPDTGDVNWHVGVNAEERWVSGKN